MMRVRLASVIDAICQEYGISRQDICGLGREPRVMTARYMAMWMGVNKCLKDPVDVAALIGNRARQTVYDGCKTIEGHMAQSEYFRDKVEQIWNKAVEAERVYIGKCKTKIIVRSDNLVIIDDLPGDGWELKK